MDTPAYPSNIGKTRYLKSIDGVRISFIVEDEIVLPQGDGSKLVYLQKFRGIHEDTVEYRFTYYMLGVKPRRKGKWVFGQYSLIIPAHELPTLLTEARKRGWDGF